MAPRRLARFGSVRNRLCIREKTREQETALAPAEPGGPRLVFHGIRCDPLHPSRFPHRYLLPSCRSSSFTFSKASKKSATAFRNPFLPPNGLRATCRWEESRRLSTAHPGQAQFRIAGVRVSAAVSVCGFRDHPRQADESGLSSVLEVVLPGQHLDEGQYPSTKPGHRAKAGPGVVLVRARNEWLPRVEDPAEALEALKKFDFILLDNIPFFKEKLKYIVPVMKAYPDNFVGSHVTKSPETYVIRIIKNGP